MRRRSSIASLFARHRSHVALRDHALHVILRRGLEPHREAVRRAADKVAGSETMPPGVAITALGCDSTRLFERAELVAPVGGRAVELVDLGERAAGQLSISRLSSTNGTLARPPRASGRASTCRRRAGRSARSAACAPGRARPSGTAPRARRARAAAPRRRGRAASRGSAAIRPTPCRRRSARPSEQSSAAATWRSTRTDALPTPISRFARWRSDTPVPRQRPSRHARARAQRAHAFAERGEKRLALACRAIVVRGACRGSPSRMHRLRCARRAATPMHALYCLTTVAEAGKFPASCERFNMPRRVGRGRCSGAIGDPHGDAAALPPASASTSPSTCSRRMRAGRARSPTSTTAARMTLRRTRASRAPHRVGLARARASGAKTACCC